MRTRLSRGPAWPICVLLVLCAFFFQASAQGCSASNPCATGCCSKHGYCGTGDDYCGDDVCVANCDYVEVLECDATKPCALGCCSKFGVCGMGPDYCSADNCVSSCDQKSECDPDNWGTAYANRTTCPLNVCCSKYGFCGTTEEFCGSKEVKRPSCSGDGARSLKRVVGYYEGWAQFRDCNRVWPEQIPSGIYTHLNYAFATIDPETFEVIPPNDWEANTMKRLVGLKLNDPGLKINIAIGGWSFNDPGPTETTFSDLAASPSNQKKFFKSLISFMATYGFDGVDIDWEYPGADDRAGRPEDFANFPVFMANLKKALQGTGGRSEISLTLPTSYWYLQHFDIKSLAKHIDYFNYMSYDLHGTWDRGNKWTGAFLDAHTNLTEITEVMDLMWRNDINPDQVVLGLAFYARAFTMSDPNCKTGGCKFASGANEGTCSRETGVLLNSEIDTIRKEREIEPQLDRDAAVQVLSWDDQWVAYDDPDTFEIKIDFALNHCLGGVMVWAVSHDNQDFTYSNSLASLAPPAYKPGIFIETTEDDGSLFMYKEERSRQCRWTGCGELCSDGWTAVYRADADRHSNSEIMLDSVTCPPGSLRTLCCPELHNIKCGWYTPNGGRCDSTCPSGWSELGSVSTATCLSGYQAACCSSGDATKLYGQLAWANFPECGHGDCEFDTGKPTTLGSSATGSGDAICDVDTTWSGGIDYTQLEERKLCYDDSKTDLQWENCRWWGEYGLKPNGTSDMYCRSACPNNQARVALDTHPAANNMCDGGALAMCCDDNFLVQTHYLNREPAHFDKALKNYLVDGYCPLTDDTLDDADNASALSVRAEKSAYDYFEAVLPVLVGIFKRGVVLNEVQRQEVGTWNNWVVSNGWPGLVRDKLAAFLSTSLEWGRMGEEFVLRRVLCNPGAWTELVETKSIPVCLGDLCEVEPELCVNVDEPVVGSDAIVKRLPRGDYTADEQSLLASDSKKYKIWSDLDGMLIDVRFEIYPLKHYSANNAVWENTKQFLQARPYADRIDCSNPFIWPQIKSNGGVFHTEHIIELQNIGDFFEGATKGETILGRTFRPISATFFINEDGDSTEIDQDILPDRGSFVGDPTDGISTKPSVRIMAALGSESSENRENFYLLEDVVNGIKNRIFGGTAIVEELKWDTLIKNITYPGPALKAMKGSIAVWHYLQASDVQMSWVQLNENLRAVWGDLDALETGDYSFLGAWNLWYCDWLDHHKKRSYDFVIDGIERMRVVWQAQPATDPLTIMILAMLAELEGHADAIIAPWSAANVFTGVC